MINFKKRTLAVCCTILFLTPGQDNGLRVEVSQLSLMGTTPRKCGYAGSIWGPPRDSPRSPFVYLIHCTSRTRLFADDTLIYSTTESYDGRRHHAVRSNRPSGMGPENGKRTLTPVSTTFYEYRGSKIPLSLATS